METFNSCQYSMRTQALSLHAPAVLTPTDAAHCLGTAHTYVLLVFSFVCPFHWRLLRSVMF